MTDIFNLFQFVLLIKFFVAVLVIFYFVFAVVIYKQILLMTQILNSRISPIVRVVAVGQILAVGIVGLLAVILI